MAVDNARKGKSCINSPTQKFSTKPPQGARERERQAIDHSIELLQAADKPGSAIARSGRGAAVRARLWAILVEDLAKADNDLPQKLRAELISIGLWVMGEAERIRLEKSTNFKGLIEVSQTIRDGLA